MSAVKPASWTYAEEFVAEPDVVETARRAGIELEARPIGVGGGAALRMLAAAAGARAVMEIGSGAGSSGLWLLQGMPADGVLTTIDIAAESSRAAKQAYAAAGIAHQRTRVITGAALEVLPRMTDGAYDLVFIDADKENYPAYAEHAIRLLRPGGVMALDNMLAGGRVAEPATRDPRTVVLRELGKTLREDERLITNLLAAGDGLLVAIKR